MVNQVSNKEVLKAEQNNGLLIKVAGSILTAGIIAMVGMAYRMDRSLLEIQKDMGYIKIGMKNFDARLSKVEGSRFTDEDAEQLKTWMELKLEALNVQVQSNKTNVNDVRKIMESK